MHLCSLRVLPVVSLHWAISSMSSLGYGYGPAGITIAELGFTIFCQVIAQDIWCQACDRMKATRHTLTPASRANCTCELLTLRLSGAR